jgi:amphi-Trp domain-containing protein
MDDGAHLPDDADQARRTITDGFFEREVYLSRDETAGFLRDLADQVESDTTLTVSSDEWEIPFEYDGPVEVEVEFSDRRERELEIEVEFTEPSDTGSVDVS